MRTTVVVFVVWFGLTIAAWIGVNGMLAFLVFWLAGSSAIGVLADDKGRNGFVWFVLTLFLTPLITGFALATMGGMKCPHCGGNAKDGATVCRKCGRDIIAA